MKTLVDVRTHSGPQLLQRAALGLVTRTSSASGGKPGHSAVCSESAVVMADLRLPARPGLGPECPSAWLAHEPLPCLSPSQELFLSMKIMEIVKALIYLAAHFLVPSPFHVQNPIIWRDLSLPSL